MSAEPILELVISLHKQRYITFVPAVTLFFLLCVMTPFFGSSVQKLFFQTAFKWYEERPTRKSFMDSNFVEVCTFYTKLESINDFHVGRSSYYLKAVWKNHFCTEVFTLLKNGLHMVIGFISDIFELKLDVAHHIWRLSLSTFFSIPSKNCTYWYKDHKYDPLVVIQRQ